MDIKIKHLKVGSLPTSSQGNLLKYNFLCASSRSFPNWHLNPFICFWFSTLFLGSHFSAVNSIFVTRTLKICLNLGLGPCQASPVSWRSFWSPCPAIFSARNICKGVHNPPVFIYIGEVVSTWWNEKLEADCFLEMRDPRPGWNQWFNVTAMKHSLWRQVSSRNFVKTIFSESWIMLKKFQPIP